MQTNAQPEDRHPWACDALESKHVQKQTPSKANQEIAKTCSHENKRWLSKGCWVMLIALDLLEWSRMHNYTTGWLIWSEIFSPLVVSRSLLPLLIWVIVIIQDHSGSKLASLGQPPVVHAVELALMLKSLLRLKCPKDKQTTMTKQHLPDLPISSPHASHPWK